MRRTVLVALAAAAATALLVPAASQGAAPAGAGSPQAAAAQAAGGPQAFAARNCRLGRKSRKLGPTYTTSLKVRRAGCRKGKRLVKAFYNCRVRNGGKDGHCRRVGRWRCKERRFNEIPTQYDARVKCKRGRKVVRHTYTQYT